MHCPPIDPANLARLWKSELRSDQICVELGCTRGHLFNMVRKYRLGMRPLRFQAPRKSTSPDPTPEDIERGTAAIRATWTEQERRSRMVGCSRGRVEVHSFKFHREHYVFSS